MADVMCTSCAHSTHSPSHVERKAYSAIMQILAQSVPNVNRASGDHASLYARFICN